MELVPLGSSDLRISRVGLGCNNFGGRLDLARTRAVVDAALDAGVTFLDTADIYGNRGDSERFLGELLQSRRDRIVLATKVGNDMGTDGGVPRGSRAYVLGAVDASLARLRVDHVDLLYYHRPDGVTPLAETIGALHEVVDAGKARWLGCSNLTAAQLEEAVAAARAGSSRLVALQNEYSLLERGAERDVLPRCVELGLGFVPYFPLASGLLTGKYRRGGPAPAASRLEHRVESTDAAVWDRVEALEQFAAARGRTLLELAIAALASRGGVSSVIVGATSPEQVRQNAAAGEWRLGAGELAELDAL
ncbi:MAG TPA: aldo/keto reductase [Gaiellaceae bacterium]|nr:aldo/keto reductase [Gaiellaceae bacterium]